MSRIMTGAFALALGMSVALPAAGATLVSGGSVAQRTLTDAGEVTFSAAVGAGTIAFDLVGYNTLDGLGAFAGGVDYSDQFNVSLNGVTIYSGYWVLGGAGADQPVSNAANFTAVRIAGTAPGGAVSGTGGTVRFSAGTGTLLEGTNTLRFVFQTLNPQPFGDESFAISSVTVTGAEQQAAVPEPATWGLMLVGFGMAGSALRRRRTAIAFA